MSTVQQTTTTKKKTGFATLSPEKRKQMAQRGNAASQAVGNTGFTSDTARVASLKKQQSKAKVELPLGQLSMPSSL